jgi:sugar/nucleoside kinase (ribokinase family)
MNEWLPLLTYFFSNSDEAVSITNAFSAEEALKRLALKTPLPLVKIGSEGALILVDGVVKTIASKKVEVVDTTGAGDSFDAGFLYATLEKKMDLTPAVEFANLVAARSCKFIGGVNARSSYEDILKFKEE